MITQEKFIRWAMRGSEDSAIAVAAAMYEKWNSDIPFVKDLAEYLVHGIVVTRPNLFLMAAVINIAPEGAPEPEPAWYIRMAVGDLFQLIQALPCYLPKICFCRHSNPRVRMYPLARLAQLTHKMKGN